MYNVFYLTKSIGNKRNNENVRSRNNVNNHFAMRSRVVNIQDS